MATEKRIYTINLTAISQGGATCKNPTITWEKPDCVNIRCGEEDSNEITIEIPAGCPDDCIYATVDCSDTCSLCEPERIKICPCDTPADCPDCETCVDNICITTCPTGQFCLDSEICGECDDDHPCPCNSNCVSGFCECPPESPYRDEKGCCSNCDATHPCDPCFICTPDGCVPKDCEHCNTETGDCVECLNSTHCTEANTCCVADECVCCEGYIKDPSTGNCILAPDCIRDTDCSECQICNSLGKCAEVTCPTGYIRIPGSPCCAKECDCEDPSCPRSENCIRLDEDNCYCAPCSGTCDENGDCGDGCYCAAGGQCKPNPCSGRCNNGFDCGEGCGCDDDGFCVPCSSLDCATNECRDVDGCECSGTDCVKSGCGGGCELVSDCPPGCACFQGTCVKCEDLDCETQCPFALGCDCIGEACIESPCLNNCVDADDCPGVDCGCKDFTCVSCLAYTCGNCPEGCICNEVTNECMGNPCNQVYCETDVDCGPNCQCDGGICKPCPADNPNCNDVGPCTDTLLIGKVDDGCDLESALTTKNCCGCEENSVGLKLNAPVADTASGANRYKFTGEIQLRHGTNVGTWTGFTSQDLLGDFDFGDLPVLGSFEVTCEQIYTGNWTDSTDIVVDMTGKDEHLITDTPKIEFTGIGLPGQVYTVGGQTRTLLEVRVVLASGTLMKMPDGCLYSIGDSEVFSAKTAAEVTAIGTKSKAFELLRRSLCKNPRFSWFSSATPTNIMSGTNFRNEYGEVVLVNGLYTTYKDTVETIAEGLVYGKYYGVRTNCGCATDKFYSCESGGDPSKLAFCKLTDFDFTISECCTKITFDLVSIDCDIMQGASPGVKYNLWVNGEDVSEQYTLLSTGVLIPNGTTFTHDEVVTSVELRMEDDACGVCSVSKTATCVAGSVDFEFIIDPCYSSGDIEVKITTTGAGSGAKDYVISNGVDADVTGSFVGSTVTVGSVPVTEGEYTVTVTLSDACELTATKDLVISDTDPDEVLLISSGCNGTAGYITGTNNSTEAAVLSINTVLYYVPAGQTYTVTATSGTLYDILFYFQSAPSCVVTISDLVVSCCDPIELTDFVVSGECQSSTSIKVTMENNSSETVIFSFYSGSGGSVSIAAEKTVVAGGTATQDITIPSGYTLGTVKVRSANGDNCFEYIVETFDITDCAAEILEDIVVTGVCGDGVNEVFISAVNNTSPTVSYVMKVNTVTVYSGEDDFDISFPTPGVWTVEIIIDGGSKTVRIPTTGTLDCR